MTRLRRPLLIGLGVVALLVATLMVAAARIPEDRLATAVVARAESTLGQPVEIGAAQVGVLPLPHVRLLRITIGGVRGDPALAVIPAARLRLGLLLLLRGEVVVTRVALHRPRVLVEISAGGESTLPPLTGETRPQTRFRAAPAAGGGARNVPAEPRFRIRTVLVEGGRLTYRDRRSGAVVRMDGWNQRLRLRGSGEEARAGRVGLEGSVAFEDVDARLPAVVLPVEDRAIRMVHESVLDRAADRLVLRKLTVEVDGVPLTGSARVDSVASAARRIVEISLAAPGLRAGELAAWLPERLRRRLLRLPDGSELTVGGSADVSLHARGPLTPDDFPSFDATLAIVDGSLADGGDLLVRGVRAEGAMAAESAVVRFNGEALGERFTAGLALRNPASPSVVAALGGRAELHRLSELGLLPDTLGLAGSLRVDMQLLVPLNSRRETVAAGQLDLTGVRAAGLEPALAAPYATALFQGPRVRVEGVPVRLDGGAELLFSIASNGWLAALMDSTAPPPEVVAEIRADSLDLDALARDGEAAYPALLFTRIGEALTARPGPAGPPEGEPVRLPGLPAMEGELRVVAGWLRWRAVAHEEVNRLLEIRPE